MLSLFILSAYPMSPCIFVDLLEADEDDPRSPYELLSSETFTQLSGDVVKVVVRCSRGVGTLFQDWQRLELFLPWD